MFVIEVINHVIVAVLLEICVFHLTLTLLYCGIILPSVREWYYNRQDSVAGLFCFPRILAGARHLEIVRLTPMEQTNAGWKYEIIGQLTT